MLVGIRSYLGEYAGMHSFAITENVGSVCIAETVGSVALQNLQVSHSVDYSPICTVETTSSCTLQHLQVPAPDAETTDIQLQKQQDPVHAGFTRSIHCIRCRPWFVSEATGSVHGRKFNAIRLQCKEFRLDTLQKVHLSSTF